MGHSVYPHSSTSGRDAGWFDWAYKGVDHTFPGNGGPECRDFLSISQRCWESAAASLVGLCALVYAYPRLTLPVPCPSRSSRGEPLGKRVLLLLMCLTFGIELGFKFSTRQMIWIGNPCHLATMMQIFILAAPPSRIVTAAFRLHMHMLTGAPIAILFPVINTRLLPFETGVYFLQHLLMLIIPFYLMKIGDPFIPEKLLDFKWALMSFGFLYIYHFLPLQYLAYLSQVNLNNMLCPAVSDPFHGKYYRLFAICHQIILIPTLGKFFVIIAKAFNILPCNDLCDAPLSDVFGKTPSAPCPCDPPVCCPPTKICESSCSESSNCDSGISGTFKRETSKCCSSCPTTSQNCTNVCDLCNCANSTNGDKDCTQRCSPPTQNLNNISTVSLSPPEHPQSSSHNKSPNKRVSTQNEFCNQGYVSRTLVNGKVVHCEDQQAGKDCLSSPFSDSPPVVGKDGVASRGPVTSSCHKRRDYDNNGPMRMSELDDRNGHAKAH